MPALGRPEYLGWACLNTDMFKLALNWLAARAAERTTWVGVIGMLSTIGVGIKPELAETIASLGVSVASLVLVVTKDKSK
jgi:hypothetical protein